MIKSINPGVRQLGFKEKLAFTRCVTAGRILNLCFSYLTYKLGTMIPILFSYGEKLLIIKSALKHLIQTKCLIKEHYH